MAVGIKRDGDLRVTEHLLNDLRVHAFSQCQGCGRVAEVVETDPGQTGLLQQRLKGPPPEATLLHG